MHIVCSTDDHFVQHCGVMLTSLFENNKDEIINIYLIYINLNIKNREIISDIVLKYKGKVIFYEMNDQLLLKLPTSKAITLSTYMRLFISNLLPDTIDRVLYLDCDIVINGSLKELWNIDVSEVALGGVEDYLSNFSVTYSRLKYDCNYGYFNAGVLLVNMEYWRRNDLYHQLCNFIKLHSDRILFHDQDILNAVCYDSNKKLSWKWNLLECNIKLYREYEVKEPVIIHFAGPVKPWHYGCRNYYGNLYYKYLEMTVWRDFIPSIRIYFKEVRYPYCFFHFIYCESFYEKIGSFMKRLLKK